MLICPICNKQLRSKSLKRHLGLMKDEKHKNLYEEQKKIAIELFNDWSFTPSSDVEKYNLLFNYKDCKALWSNVYSEKERKSRGDYLKKHVAWNKGLSVNNNEKMRQLQNKRNITMSKVLKEKYENGEMKAWKKGLTKENNKKVKKAAEKLSKTMSGIIPCSYGISGIRKDIGHHAASTYEANIYRILQYHNVDYLYEFDNVKEIIYPNGEVRCYRIDIKDVDGFFGVKGAYIEVKGFFNQRDRMKVKLFREQYPNEKLFLIGYGDKREKYYWEPDIDYAELEKKYKPLISLWEDKNRNLRTHPELYS